MTKETLKYMIDSLPAPTSCGDQHNISFEDFYFKGLEISLIGNSYFFVMPIKDGWDNVIKTYKSFKAGKTHVYNYLIKFF